MRNLKWGLVAAILSVAAAISDPAIAQSWPSSKPITVLNPAPAGGVLDNLLRSTSEFVSRKIGQTIIVDSRSGGAGIPVAQAIVQGGTDGYLIGANYASHVINPHTIKNLTYDTFRDFAPVTRLADLIVLLVAPATAPYSSVPEMIKYARDNPGKISFGIPGVGGSVHFSFESFRQIAGVSIEPIPYRGEAPTLADLLGDRLQLTMLSTGTAKPHVDAGKIKILAVVTEKRVASLPNVPTLAEALPGYKPFLTWYGLFMRAGTAQAIVDRVASEYRAALQDPEIKAKLENVGLLSVGSTPAEFATQLRDEHETYGELIRKTGFKIE